jgi:hypothetical protein
MVALALLILWGFSPLATQAMQRISSLGYSDSNTTMSIAYLNAANGYNYLSDSSNESSFPIIQPDMTRLYSAAFLTDNYNFGADFFGNALIPVIADLPSDPPGSDDDWRIVDWTNSYSSLYGLPVALPNLTDSDWTSTSDSDITYNVTAKTAYLTFSCSDVNTTTLDEIGHLFPDSISNPTLFMAMKPMQGNISGTLDFASWITNGPDAENATYTEDVAYSTCTFNQAFVDVNISCQYDSCAVWAIKPTTNPPGFVFSGNQTADAFLEASGALANNVATDTERYIMYGFVIDSDINVNLAAISHSDFTTRLSLLFNTYWQIGFGPSNFTTPLRPQLSANTVDGPGSRIDHYEISITSWGWFAALMVSCGFLLMASIASIISDARTISPHVLGFAHSVVRKSKHVPMPPVRPAASGAERIRALGEVRVMMQDFKPKEHVGQIALGTVHPGAKKLEVGRSYR